MDQKNTSGPNTAPRLLVKIVGSKQVKQFVQAPRQDVKRLPAEDASDDAFEKPAEKQDEAASGCDTQADSALWAAINQVPDRLCVTAPSGDRSRSYIHPKTQSACESRAAEVLQISEREGASGDADKAALSSAVREELSDWQLSSLTSAEDEAAALDLAIGGTLDRSDVTQLFLKRGVPLKFPTFSLLLQMFSDERDPAQIHYRNLLQFIRTSAFCEEL